MLSNIIPVEEIIEPLLVEMKHTLHQKIISFSKNNDIMGDHYYVQ